ncbi:MAG: hypothetical protein A2786_00995 [Candidatus Chisholmbacteria bacterium RIFCSPHIGHO2_01_FULL_52_32]|uniref:dolichyl-phosphate beta-glucosyltransferase n=1 Tax=Candidatus Chisholmbacteria bacterium RIFCSPHIGHO2_01_FULL_52_32 TaxID=1797591 RepID=A0A1G1VUC0_9BACT|nr:MAG: hypothetical protein A2786_00995 [Candidatus Chisholmbacteria bacterium RIFCSPHIGHO2_01_FULL_52_32]
MVLLSVVIPAYNEERRIGKTISRVHSYFLKRGTSHEIILVDDGSTDNTGKIAQQAGKLINKFRLVTHDTNLGKGAAVRSGVREARGDWILFTDCDLSVPIEEFEKLWSTAKVGYDVVIGSRIRGARIRRDQGVVRRTLGKLFRWLVRLLVLGGVSDSQCGFKLFTRGIGQRAFAQVQTDGALFDIEFLLAAKRLGARTLEVPVIWEHNPQTRIPYSFLSSIEVFWELCRITYHWRIT